LGIVLVPTKTFQSVLPFMKSMVTTEKERLSKKKMLKRKNKARMG
jgi:hypothetical protein